MLNFPKIPKIALRKFSELSHTLWRSKRAKSTQDSFLLGGSSYRYFGNFENFASGTFVYRCFPYRIPGIKDRPGFKDRKIKLNKIN